MLFLVFNGLILLSTSPSIFIWIWNYLYENEKNLKHWNDYSFGFQETTRKSNDKAKTFYGLAYGIGSTFDLDGTGEPSDSIITEESVNNEEEDNANKTQNRDDEGSGFGSGSWYLQQQQRPQLTRQFTAYTELCSCCIIL